MSTGEPRLLLLETSGRIGQVAVAEGPRLLGVRRLDEGRRHARDLAPAVADLLSRQGWQPRDIRAVIVSRGPGSYTGLRVGVMSAKAFAYATGCALIAVDTFEIVAAQAPPEAQTVYVLADAQQDHLYVQRYERNPSWLAASDLTVVPASTWLTDRNAAAWTTGPGVSVVASRLPPSSRVIAPDRREPAVESLHSIGLARYQAGRFDDLRALEPLYARPSSAEQKLSRDPEESVSKRFSPGRG